MIKLVWDEFHMKGYEKNIERIPSHKLRSSKFISVNSTKEINQFFSYSNQFDV